MVEKMKLLAVVITYYPKIEQAILNIKQYIDEIDLLIIWENTPEEDRVSHYIYIPEYKDKILYQSTGKNEGIAYALNQTVYWAIDNKYTHILTMDQDSYWENFDEYKNTVAIYLGKYKIFSPNINHVIDQSESIMEIKASITSGSVYDLDLFKEIGFFREDYFIDAVDTEFSYRAFRNSYPTVCITNAHLKQQFGDPIKCYGIKTSNYSAFRTYYIVRNHIWLWREYPDIISKELRCVILGNYIIIKMVQILLVENDKINKMKSLMKGVYKGIFR